MNKFLSVIIISLFGALLIFTVSKNFKFYGFEYEDAFINSYIASEEKYADFIDNYRTLGCSKLINNNCSDSTSFTGHYFPYSLYLSTISKVLKTKNEKIHKIGNFILCLLWISILLLAFKKIELKSILIILGIIACLPFYYVFNSSLVENLSFTIGTGVIILIYKYGKSNLRVKSVIILLITILALTKRENLLYLLLAPLFLNRLDLKYFKIIIPLFILVISQIIINPFYTEFLESDYLKLPTFSFNYLKFQLPVYFSSLYLIKGFLPLTLIILYFSLPNKKSLYLLGIFLSFIGLYSIHYRSQFAIKANEIDLFDTYRYMVNAFPFFIGFYFFSKFRKTKIPILILSLLAIVLTLWNTVSTFKYFIEDENSNYHNINYELNKIADEKKLIIFDNFNLISMLNSENDIDIYELSYDNIDNLLANFKFKNNIDYNILLINRFNSNNMNEINSNSNPILIDSLSTKSSNVYSLDMRYLKVSNSTLKP